MTGKLRLVFSFILLTIIGANLWACLQMPAWETPRAVATHPWFIATLFDTYLAFFTFWLWVAYQQRSNLARGIWLLLIFALGNIAMSSYALIRLWRLPADATAEDFLLRRA